VRVDQAGESAVEGPYRDEVYQAEFATQALADRLAVVDPRPFAENTYNRLAVWGVQISMGGAVTHEEPKPEHQVEAEKPRELGFTHEQIVAAQARNAQPPPTVDALATPAVD